MKNKQDFVITKGVLVVFDQKMIQDCKLPQIFEP